MGMLKRANISPRDRMKRPSQEEWVLLSKGNVESLTLGIAAWPFSTKERKTIHG